MSVMVLPSLLTENTGSRCLWWYCLHCSQKTQVVDVCGGAVFITHKKHRYYMSVKCDGAAFIAHRKHRYLMSVKCDGAAFSAHGTHRYKMSLTVLPSVPTEHTSTRCL